LAQCLAPPSSAGRWAALEAVAAEAAEAAAV